MEIIWKILIENIDKAYGNRNLNITVRLLTLLVITSLSVFILDAKEKKRHSLAHNYYSFTDSLENNVNLENKPERVALVGSMLKPDFGRGSLVE